MTRTLGFALSTAALTALSGVAYGRWTLVRVTSPSGEGWDSPAAATVTVTTFSDISAGTLGLSRNVCSRNLTPLRFHRCVSYSESIGHPNGKPIDWIMGMRQRLRNPQYRSQWHQSLGSTMIPPVAVASASRSRTACLCGASMNMCR